MDKEEKWKMLDPELMSNILEVERSKIPSIDQSIKRMKQAGVNPYTKHPYKRFQYRKIRRLLGKCIQVLDEIKSTK